MKRLILIPLFALLTACGADGEPEPPAPPAGSPDEEQVDEQVEYGTTGRN